MMNHRVLIALFAVATVPLATCSYGSQSSNSGYGAGNGIDELVHAATGGSQQQAAAITRNAEVQPSPLESARLSQVQQQLSALNGSPTYRNIKNSEDISDSLAESNLASNLRQGNVNVVAPNIVDQGVFRSLLVPSGQNNHQVIATQPLPPIIVNQPASPPAHVSSGPAAIVKAAPVIYKIKPSVIYQQEVINKVPTPLSLNPVYVKVYKPGKKVDAPVAPVVQPVYQPKYESAYGNQNSASSGDSYGSGSGSAPLYASAPYGGSAGGHGGSGASYGQQNSGSYGQAPSY